MFSDLIGGAGWKIGAIGTAVALLFSGVWLLAVKLENRHLTQVNLRLDDLINNPDHGYARKLATERANVATLKAAMVEQKARFQARADEDAKALAASQAQLSIAQKTAAQARRTAEKLLVKKPEGSSLEARILDVDARIVGALN